MADESKELEAKIIGDLEDIARLGEKLMDEANELKNRIKSAGGYGGTKASDLSLDDWAHLDAYVYNVGDEHRHLRDLRKELQISAIEDLL